MVTNAEEPEPEPTAGELRRQAFEGAVRSVIAGSPVGSVRRIALYLIVGLSLPIAALGGSIGAVFACAGIFGLFLLIGTDDLR